MISSDAIKILLVDNYDSFTYNLYQLLGSFPGVKVVVLRNDAITLSEVISGGYDAIVLSPGPGNPENDRDFGICKAIITHLKGKIPILGVCLGHQGMGYLLQGSVIRASKILHGKTSKITHSASGIFAGIPQKIHVARYHSLILDRSSLPDTIEITAETQEGEIMGIQHHKFPLFGVQFHPESFMTEYGKEMVENFLTEISQFHQLLVEA